MTTKQFKGKAIRYKHSKRIKTNGYYAIYAPDHPHSFGRGYVYEHRLVIEKQIGRLLLPTEIVHHIDCDRLNNDTSNLMLCSSIAEHKVQHRSKKSKVKKLPDEQNQSVKCACGCGRILLRYDDYGRERLYFSSGCPQRKSKVERQKIQGMEIVLCACGCGEKIQKYDTFGRVRKYISGHNASAIPNRTFVAKDTGLSFSTVVHYFKGYKLSEKTIRLIEQSIINNYGKDYIRKQG